MMDRRSWRLSPLHTTIRRPRVIYLLLCTVLGLIVCGWPLVVARNRLPPSDPVVVPAIVRALPVLTQLHNEILAKHLDQQVIRDVVLEILESQGSPQRRRWLLWSGKPDVSKVVSFATRLHELLKDTGRVIPCRIDTTLPNYAEDKTSTAAKVFIAANLYNSEVVLPHFTFSLVTYLLHMPLDSNYVSIYESNSQDSTAVWLDILKLTLQVIGVPSCITSRGTMVRAAGQQRIEYLAAVRNAALQPLYDHYELTSLAEWQDMLRLQLHDADTVCGTDWEQNIVVRKSQKREDWTRRWPKPIWPPEITLSGPAPTSRSLELAMPILFYDMWVSRDITGSRFKWLHPFTQDKHSAQLFTAGLPFRAQCCWNGLVVLNAEPFRRGLRIRASVDDECRASESTLVCNDFARLGFDRVVVDPSVQLAYSFVLSQEVITRGVGGVNISTWAQAAATGVGNMQQKPAFDNVECCFIKPNVDWVDFRHDCARENIMATNFTAIALAKRDKP